MLEIGVNDVPDTVRKFLFLIWKNSLFAVPTIQIYRQYKTVVGEGNVEPFVQRDVLVGML